MDDIESEYTVGAFKPGVDLQDSSWNLQQFLNRYYNQGYELAAVDPPYYIFRRR